MIELYDIGNKPFMAVSAGTGTACIYHADKKFNHLGGISIGGGTLQGLSNYLLNTNDPCEIEDLAASGDRKSLDILIGEAVNKIGALYPEITYLIVLVLPYPPFQNAYDDYVTYQGFLDFDLLTS